MRPRDEAVGAGDAIALDNGRQLVEQCSEFAELVPVGNLIWLAVDREWGDAVVQ